MNYKELLINKDKVVMTSVDLAVIIGDCEEAIVLNQISYWLEKYKEVNHNLKDGRYWVYNSYQKWHEDNFPFWNPSKIKRIFRSLENKGLLISANYNSAVFDKTKWYTIDYDKLQSMTDNYESKKKSQKVIKGVLVEDEPPLVKNDQSLPASDQPIPENTIREYSTENTVKEHALLSTKVDNREKYMVSRTKSAQNSGASPKKKEPTVDPDDFIKSKESVLKDELHRLYSNNPKNIFTTEQQENDWVDKEYNSLTAIIFEFNHQYKASTGFDAKNLSDESLKRVVRSYIKSPESLKDDYDDLESNKVLIEEYLKTDYGSKHGVIVKSLSHYMSGSIREMLFYKHLF